MIKRKHDHEEQNTPQQNTTSRCSTFPFTLLSLSLYIVSYRKSLHSKQNVNVIHVILSMVTLNAIITGCVTTLISLLLMCGGDGDGGGGRCF